MHTERCLVQTVEAETVAGARTQWGMSQQVVGCVATPFPCSSIHRYSAAGQGTQEVQRTTRLESDIAHGGSAESVDVISTSNPMIHAWQHLLNEAWVPLHVS